MGVAQHLFILLLSRCPSPGRRPVPPVPRCSGSPDFPLASWEALGLIFSPHELINPYTLILCLRHFLFRLFHGFVQAVSVTAGVSSLG